MKYIRTIDGKIIESELLKHCDSPFEQWFINNTDISWKENPTLNQADTIEELFDKFVIVGTNNSIHSVYKNFADARHAMVCLEKESHYSKDFIIYGAIETDKGLIYKAKMNEKGELELL